MKSAFPILAAVALLLGASTAQAAKPMGNSNIILAPTPPLQSTLRPQTNPGAPIQPPLGTLASPSTLGFQQSFGALPGNPGSATYNPNAALPTLGTRVSDFFLIREHRASTPRAPTSTAACSTPRVSWRLARIGQEARTCSSRSCNEEAPVSANSRLAQSRHRTVRRLCPLFT